MDTGRAFCWKFISAAKSVAWWWAGGWPVGSAIKQIGEDAGNIRMRILTVNYLGLGSSGEEEETHRACNGEGAAGLLIVIWKWL